MTSTPAASTLADRCPGLLRPHYAADGAVIRLRLVGGRTTATALAALANAAGRFGDGNIQLTSRGNLQMRGVPVDDRGRIPPALAEAVLATGLVPSITHELVRNIVCSPPTGRFGGVADLRGLTDDLDRLLCTTPALARLSGRFLFALDDGRMDVARLTHDLGVRAVSAARVQVVVAGLPGPVVPLPSAARLLIDLALAFLRLRDAGGTPVWHVRQLPRGGAELLDEVDIVCCATADPAGGPAPSAALVPGPTIQRSGGTAIVLAVPLGLLNAGQVEAITAAAAPAGEIIVTPWRQVLIPDLLREPGETAAIGNLLTGVGLDLDPGSGWRGLSACAGAPGCARAAAPTGPIADLLARRSRDTSSLPIHVVACERRCGAPSFDHVEVLLLGTTSSIRRRPGVGSPGPRPHPVVFTDRLAALTAATALSRTGS